jgi:hypothetical protein
MIDPALRESLAAFDDAALATLANPGLVRRAHRDVEEGKLRLVSASDGNAEVEADGELVRIDTRGPRTADCACKSATVCRHRIAAVLFLQAVPAGESASDDQEDADPYDIAEALDPQALEKWAGKASWRAALELVTTAASVESAPNAISVQFAELDNAVRILRGQGFDGIVSKAPTAKRKALHAAAVLAARQHFGLGVPEARIDDESPVAPIEVNTEFLDRVAAALGEVAALGFNLAPLPLEESLFELSVSSRADSLPRLAAMLRAIAAQVRLRRQRALAYDPDAMLERAATAFALTRALRNASGERLISLAGKVRRDFNPAPPVTLIGCGGERWRTLAGARGVTAWFLEPATGRWLSTTLARGQGQDPQFMPGEAWRTQPLWQAEPLNSLAHARFELTGANQSADGRLSAPASATARILAPSVRPDANWHCVIRDWAALRPAYLRESGLGLDAAATPAACLLAPAQTGTPYFDDLAQQLVWPLCDDYGQWLALTLDHEEPVSTAIEALEATIKRGWTGQVLVKISRAGEHLAVTPITLFGTDTMVDLTLWQRPWDARDGKVRGWLERLRIGPKDRAFAKPSRSTTDAAVAAAWRLLLDRAEAGPGLASTLQSNVKAHADLLDSFGLPTLAAQLRSIDQDNGLLAAGYAFTIACQLRCTVTSLG